jgi:hypothetical protein
MPPPPGVPLPAEPGLRAVPEPPPDSVAASPPGAAVCPLQPQINVIALAAEARRKCNTIISPDFVDFRITDT